MTTPTTIALRGYSYRYLRIPVAASETSLPPVVFLGGAFQSMDSWRSFANVFAPLSDVVLVDLPGSGAADPLPPEFGLDFLAEALEKVFDRLELRPAFLVCASYGSPIGYRFAQRFPDRTSHLVLAGIMASISDRVRSLMTQAVLLASSGRLQEFSDLILRQMLCQDPGRVIARRDSVQRAMRRGLLRMGESDVQRFVWNTQRLLDHPPLDLSRPPAVPALLFTGEHDVFTPPEECRRVAEHIPDAQFTTISQADHVFHLQRFDRTIELLTHFVRWTSLPGQSRRDTSCRTTRIA